MTDRRGMLLVVLGAATWGTTGTAQALAELPVPPVAVGAVRTVAGAVCLVVLTAVLHPGALRPAPGTRGALVVSALAVASYQVAFFAGVDAAGVALGTVVGIGSAPVLTGLVAWAADGARPEGRWWAATSLAVVGAVLVVGPGAPAGDGVTVGVLLALLAGLAYAVLTVASRRVLDAGVQPTAAMAQVFALGALPSAALLGFTGAPGLASGRGVALVAWLALVTVGAGYVLYGRGLRTVPPATVGTLTLTEPLVAATLGVTLLGERPTAGALAGAALLAGGLVLLTVRRGGDLT